MADRLDPKTAWEAWTPTATDTWDLRKVGHLYRRAGFGATMAELTEGQKAGPQVCIERLLKGADGLAPFEAETERMAEAIGRTNNGPQASDWWLYRMLYTPHPLREKLTLFWHNHFATSNAKVQNAGYMLGQYKLMYRHAMGSFDKMLQEITLDPAMLFWLDTTQSKKGMPNENYARELMELFSLGIGNYTETDIREAAKAFTGYEIKNNAGILDPKQHDDGIKTVLGQKGKFEAKDVVRICLEQKSCPYFIARKLFRFLISDRMEVSNELLAPVAEEFRKGYDFAKLVERMLRSKLFFSAAAYRGRIKSPVEFVLEIVRGLELKTGTSKLARSLETLGQNLFNPPSVKGWDGGETWLNGQTLLSRQNLALSLCETRQKEVGASHTDSVPAPVALSKRYPSPTNALGQSPDAKAISLFTEVFLQGDLPAATRERLVKYLADMPNKTFPKYWSAQDREEHRLVSLCHLVLTLPEFQLS